MKWFLAREEKPEGPYSESQIIQKIRSGELQLDSLLWNEDQGEWKTMRDWKHFSRQDIPAFQAVSQLEDDPAWVILKKGAAPAERTRGPFCKSEVLQMILSEELLEDDCIWRRGLSGWSLLRDREEFVFQFEKLRSMRYASAHDSKT